MSDLRKISLVTVINEIVRDDVHHDTFSEGITFSNVKELSDLITDALPEIVRGMVKPLSLHERRNGYWGGKCSHGYQVAHTTGDLYRVRLHGKVVCRDVKGFPRAWKWAQDHHAAQLLARLGIGGDV